MRTGIVYYLVQVEVQVELLTTIHKLLNITFMIVNSADIDELQLIWVFIFTITHLWDTMLNRLTARYPSVCEFQQIN